MKGSYRKLEDRGVVDGRPYWELSVSAGKDRVTGKYLRKVEGFRGNAKERDQRLREMVAEVEGRRAGGTAKTVGELMDRWMAAGVTKKGLPWSDTTRQRYASLLKNHIRNSVYGIGDVPLRKLSVGDLDDLYDRMTAAGLSPASVRQCHAMLHRALADAVRKEWAVRNVADHAAPPGVPKAKVAVPSAADVRRLFDLAVERGEAELASLVFVAATTGMRRGELCALRWRDVDLERGALFVHESAADITGVGVVLKDTKTHAAAWLSLDVDTVAVLLDHRQAMLERAATLGEGLASGGFVWSNNIDGARPWSPDSVSKRFAELRDAAGLPGVHLHSLRHWAATSAIAGGEDIRTVAGRLRHAKTSTTLDQYAGWVTERDQQVADRLGGLLRRG